MTSFLPDKNSSNMFLSPWFRYIGICLGLCAIFTDVSAREQIYNYKVQLVKEAFLLPVVPASFIITYVTSNYNGKEISCHGLNDGFIDLTVSGGVQPFTYSWYTGDTTEDLTNLFAGTFQVLVSDSLGDTSSISITLNEADSLFYTSSVTNSICALPNGNILLNPSGGLGGYNYLWSDGSSLQQLDSLVIGSYVATLTDSNGCSFSDVVLVGGTGLPVILSDSVIDASCFLANDGAIFITVSGGNFPYLFSWSNGSTIEDPAGLLAGNYTVLVSDSLGCVDSLPVQVNEPGLLTISFTSNQPICGNSNGTLDAQPAGGTSLYSFLWSTGDTNQGITSLNSGTYVVTVTDFAGCVQTDSVDLLNLGSPLIAIQNHTDVSCSGLANGSIDISVTSGTPPYTYSWSNGSINEDVGGLVAGNYTITVTDSNFCVSTNTFLITEPDQLLILLNQVNSTCGNANGLISPTVTGGSGPINYLWSNGETTSVIDSLLSGSYTLTVTDSLSCSLTETATILDFAGPQVTLDSLLDVTCFSGGNGEVYVSIFGGSGPITFQWSNGKTTEDIQFLILGNYTITVTDTNSCIASLSVSISEPTDIVINASVVNSTCGNSNGSITGSATGGTGILSYLWSDGSTNSLISNIFAGVYTVTVTDENGCSRTSQVTVNDTSGPVVIANGTTPVTCNGGSDGLVDITVNSGTFPFSFLWSDGSTLEDLDSIGAGNYTVIVSDANNCTFTLSATITEPLAVSISMATNNATCGLSNGSAQASASGGTGNLSFLWSDGSTIFSISNKSAAVYTVTVTDANFCTVTAIAGINNIGGPTVSITSISNIACNGDSSGSVNITILGGTSPYLYDWSNGSTTEDLTGVVAGNYFVTITDNNNCIANKNIIVSQASLITINAIVSDETCSNSNGSINLNAGGGTGLLTYLWSQGSTNSFLSGLNSGTYTVTVTDFNSCTGTASATVLNTAGPVISLSSVIPVVCNGGVSGSVNMAISGGTAPFSFLWNNGATTQNLSGIASSTYTVTITDFNSCTSTQTAIVTQPPAISTSLVPVNNVCNLNNGSVLVNAGGGSGPLSFLWSNGSTSAQISGLSGGFYTVTVTDGNSCSVSDTASVSSLPGPVALISTVFPVLCNGDTTGTINISVSGGTSPFIYLWSDGSTVEDISGVVAGNYTVTVTDLNSCTSTTDTLILEPPVLVLNTTSTNANCNLLNGTATAIPSGGNGTYTYLWSNGLTTSGISNLPAATFTVTVTDLNSCTKQKAVVVNSTLGLSVAATISGNVTCFGGNDGFIDITINGGSPPFSYLWSNGSTDEDIFNLVAGLYNVTVTDNDNCSSGSGEFITSTSQIASAFNIQNSLSGNPTGSIAAIPSGGNGNYTFLWSNGQTSTGISGLIAGTYTCTITDSSGCSRIFNPVVNNLTSACGVTISSVGDVSCNGGTDGFVDITVTGGIPPFTYLWSNGETTEDIDTLIAGIYTVTVTDSVLCVANGIATVNEPLVLISSINGINGTCGNPNGTATANASGGNGGNTYLWSTGSTNASISGLASSTYTVTVTDSKSCSSTSSVVLTNSGAPAVTSGIVTQVSCFGGTNGAINITVSGGTLPYTYSWSNGATTEDITGIAAGAFTIIVTDSNNCQVTANYSVVEPNTILIGLNTINSTCGNANGIVTSSVSGGTGTYLYSWSNGSTTANISGLPAATYTVTVTDANLCTKTSTVILSNTSGPGVVLTLKTNVSCNGGSNGSINITVSNGTIPYTYLWSNTQTTEDIASLSAGTYTITVTDANNCTVTLSTTITQPAAIVPVLSKINATCGNANGSAFVSATGGTGALSYLWTTGSINDTISGLIASTYTVTVTDANLCTQTGSVTIANIAGPSVIVTTNTNVSCNGGSNGTINITVSNGTPAYTYSWSNGTTSEDITGLPSGTYTVTVTDQNLCTATVSSQITQPTVIAININKTNATCGNANGTITASPSGGTGGFTYLWSNGNTNSTISSLTPASYTVTVTDANNCTKTATTTVLNISGPDVSLLLLTNVTCNGGSNGSINITVSSGTLPYTYSWSNGFTNEDPSGLVASVYTVTVTDANNCTDTLSVNLTQPVLLTVTLTPVNPSCGVNNGTISTVVNGGTSGYTYLWSNGTTNFSISSLAPNTYTVTVTDANLCTKTASVTLVNQVSPAVVFVALNQVSCFGGNDGTIDISVTPGTPPYTYLWSNGKSTQDNNNVIAGSYTLTVTDANGCTALADTLITEPADISVNLTKTNATCNSANGNVSVAPTGGTGSFVYSWSNGNTTASNSNLLPGTYTVTVTDNNSCTKTQSATIINIAGPLVTLTGSGNIACFGGNNGSINITVSGGTLPYTYSWSNGDTTQDPDTLVAGSYFILVTDLNGCSDTMTVVISQPGIILITTSSVNATCGSSNGSATASASGGTGSLSYLWSNGTTTATAAAIPAGAYTVTVTDASGCTKTALVNVINTGGPVVTLISITNVTCNGGSNGDINISVSGGSSPFTYSWSTGATTQDINSVAAGTYTVTVTNSLGCIALFDTLITQPAAIVITFSNSNATCGGNNGVSTATASGGTGGFTYLWSNGKTTGTNTGLGTGNYTVTVTDLSGCTKSAVTSITNTSNPSIVLNAVTNILCFGNSTGAISITVSNGTPSYTYTWSNGATIEDIAGLIAGTYTVTVSDSVGCIAVFSTPITQSAQIVPTISTTGATCNQANGSAQVSAIGGIGGYTYLWSNGKTTALNAAIVSGTYTVTVTDAVSCSVTASVSVANSVSPVIVLFNINNVNCFGGSSGDININVSGGLTPYTYSWSNGKTTQDNFNVASGNYTVTVTDQNGCTSTDSYFIDQPGLLVITDTITPANCGNSNGSASVIVTGGVSPYTYSWYTGSTTNSISGKPSGNYTILVTDSNNCTKSKVVTITNLGGPSIILDSLNDVSCYGNNNGSIYLSFSGGTSPYVYLWSTGSTSAFITGLAGGNYTITITDSTNCISNQTFVVNEPDSLDFILTGINPTCGNSNGSIIVNTVLGGTAPFSYNWSNGGTTASILNLLPGTFTLTVTDINSCTIDTTLILQDPGKPVITLDSIINVSCNGSATGRIYITVSGGNNSYTYSWSNGSTTQDLLNVLTGNYTLMVYDSIGCGDTSSITIGTPLALGVNHTTIDALCGFNNGSISTIVTGGTVPYTYSWSNGFTTSSITGLSPGIYIFTVTDNSGCTTSFSDTITNPGSPVINSITPIAVTCFGLTNGSVSITVSNGTAPYTYVWSNGSSLQNISNLPSNTYVVTVTDQNGCTITSSATVTQPVVLAGTVSTTPSSCGLSNGSATSNITGGNGGFVYLWTTNSTLSSITGVSGGVYTVTVTDIKGCTVTASGTVLSNNAPAPFLNSVSNVSCFGSTNGSINISITGGTSPFTYSWSNAATTEDLSSLGPNTYTVIVTDAFGCTGTVSAVINQPTGIAAVLLSTVASCNTANGTIKVITSGGVSPYTYLWFNNSTSDSIGGLAAGFYTLSITDQNGCILDTLAEIINPDAPSIALNLSNDVNCFGDADGFIDINVFGGTGPYTYVWNSGETTEDIQNLLIGTYTVTVTDQFGCTALYTKVINQPADISIIITTVPATCGSANGSACIAISGGVSPYVFIWSNGFTINCIQNLTAGSYPVTVTDDHGCVKIDAANISNVAGPEIAVTDSANVSCNNSTDGSINISVTAGSPGYIYQWSNGTTIQDLSGIAAGTYTVTVTDVVGCLAIKTITISEPTAILGSVIYSLNNDTFNISCYGLSDGSIDLTVSGGTAPYTYTWSNGAVTEDVSLLSAGNYTVIITDQQGCSISPAYTLNEPPALIANAGVNFTICGLDSAQLLAETPAPGLTGFWQIISGTGILADSVSPSTSVSNLSNGNVVLQWIISDGICSDSSAITISVASVVKAIAGIDIVICGDSASLTATQTLFGYGFWNSVIGNSIITDTLDPTTLVTNLQIGDNTFRWTVVNGNCSDTDYVKIFVSEPSDCLANIQMPSGFSPNGDGKNEFFIIRGLEDYPLNNITIYNRWGNLVYEKNGYDNRWDGKSQSGAVLPEGTYFVIFKIDNYPILIKGFVDVRR